jgi:hypothetical protein
MDTRRVTYTPHHPWCARAGTDGQRFRSRDWKCRKLRRLGRAAILGRFLGTFWCPKSGGEGIVSFARDSKEKDSPVYLVRVRRESGRGEISFRGNAL